MERDDEEQGFRPIGSLASTIGNTLKTSGSIPTTPRSSFGTTGLPSRVSAPASSIGPSSGRTVAESLPSVEAAMACGDPQEIEGAVVRSFGRLLALSERRPPTNDPYTTYSLVGYDLSGSRADLMAARRVLDAAMMPAKRAETVKTLVRLRLLTVARAATEDDVSMTLAAYADELADLPADAVRVAASMWARANKFWPSLAELRSGAERLCKHRLMLTEAIDRASPTSEWRPPQ